LARNRNSTPIPCNTAQEAIPIIDLSAPDPEAAAALGAACRGSGFFLAAGHGVPDDVVISMFDQIRSLFDLPIADKMALLQVHGRRSARKTQCRPGAFRAHMWHTFCDSFESLLRMMHWGVLLGSPLLAALSPC
jgi:isopenicillin N synthase-like dioxygenase